MDIDSIVELPSNGSPKKNSIKKALFSLSLPGIEEIVKDEPNENQ